MTEETNGPSNLPSYEQLMNPILHVLRELGDSGSIKEISEKVAEREALSEDQLSQLHDSEKGYQTEFDYRLSWARTYLKKYGLLENSERGVWALTTKAKEVKEVDPKEVVRFVLNQLKAKSTISGTSAEPVELKEEEEWKQRLYDILTTKIDPSAFERLAQRVMRELGFVNVDVSGQPGDCGIDGYGIARVNGLMSFHVVFQCKRYNGSVHPNVIRDFRGAMTGRADKGLFITTGSFTRKAVEEAARVPAIDLVDGNDLIEKLKQLGLGVHKEMKEIVTVDESWFNSI